MTTTTEFTEADLPELPGPFYRKGDIPSFGEISANVYDEAHMHPFALAAVAAYRKKLMQQEPVAYLRSDELRKLESALIHAKKHKADAKKYGHDVAVYAAPMPQANESEAVRALRRVVSNYEMNCSVRDAWSWHEDSYNAARAVLAGEPGAQEKGHDE